MYGKQRLSHFTALLAVTMVAACGGGERFRLRGRSRPTSSTAKGDIDRNAVAHSEQALKPIEIKLKEHRL